MALWYAVCYSRLAEASGIDSVHLLRGLMYEENSRVNTIFRLREYFPLYCGCPSRFATFAEVPKPKPAFDRDARRILARTNWEADAMRDYWIDTEHLLLGILADPSCQAAQYLAKAGLNLKDARRAVMANKSSRPDHGPVSEWWGLRSPWDKLVFKWRMRKYQS
jgi:ATP-dependent Clp protease ATP-binding subunit ClpA